MQCWHKFNTFDYIEYEDYHITIYFTYAVVSESLRRNTKKISR